MTGFALQSIRNDGFTRFIAAMLCALMLLSMRGAVAAAPAPVGDSVPAFCAFDPSLPPLVPDDAKAPAPARADGFGHCAMCVTGGGPALPPPAIAAIPVPYGVFKTAMWRVAAEAEALSASVLPHSARAPPARATQEATRSQTSSIVSNFNFSTA
jgi:hypothetical protein